LQDFLASALMIFLAELGDKTQLVALTLATRYNTRVVLAGITAATLLVHIFSAALGNLAGAILPNDWIQFLAGIAFIGFGFWTLRGDCLEGEECSNRKVTSPFFVVATVFFLAELGDKTMLSTVTLAASGSFVAVWLGSTLGMVASDGLAIWIGKVLGSRLPERAVKIGASLIFFGFGAFSAIRGGITLPPYTWVAGAMTVAGLSILFFRSRLLTDRQVNPSLGS
jgi:Ca2+/H+ antiporter, TMEM165/GDT1 family